MPQITKFAGVAHLTVDGQAYPVKGDATINLNPVEREGIAGLDGVHGYKEMPRVPFIDIEISNTAEVDLNALAKLSDVTVQFECANGKTAVLRNAWAILNDSNPVEGSSAVRFEGASGEWT